MSETMTSEDRSLSVYFDDIKRATPLPREREAELASRTRAGDLAARDELVQANLRFVVEVAKSYQRLGLPLADLIGAGNMGLLVAAERFDGRKGFKFITYAVWWVRQAILQHLGECGRTVRLPLNKVGLLCKIAKAKEKMGRFRGVEPSIEEIALAIDTSPDSVREAILSDRVTVSLDDLSAESAEGGIEGFLPSDRPPDVEYDQASMCAHLHAMLSGLGEREEKVLRLYFGFDGEDEHTLEQIGSGMGVTRERVRQLKARALEKLMKPPQFHRLCALVA